MLEPKKRNQYAFDKEKYDHIHLQVAKGERDRIRALAENEGMSLNSFINLAIREKMEIKKSPEQP